MGSEMCIRDRIISVAPIDKKQRFFLGNIQQRSGFGVGALTSQPCLTTIEALTMDEKLDDGAHNTGTVLSVFPGSVSSSPEGTFFTHGSLGGEDCVDSGGYRATEDGVRCILSFDAGF